MLFRGKALPFERSIIHIPLLPAEMNNITADAIRDFLLARYSEPIRGLGLTPDELGDDFDFFVSGVIDSFGILELVSQLEEEFRIQLDLATLDAEQISVLGPLSRFVAEHGVSVDPA